MATDSLNDWAPTVTGQESGAVSALRCAVGLAGVALCFTALDMYALVAWKAPPAVVYVVLFAVVGALLALLDVHRPLLVLQSPFGLWIAAYFVVTTAWGVWMEADPAVTQALIDRYRSVAFLLTFAVVYDDPRARRVALYAVAASVLLASVLNITELAGVLTFAQGPEPRVAGRASGMYFNPNTAGTAIALGLAVALDALPKVLRLPLVLVAIFGTAATFSRGAMVCLVVVVAWLIWRRALGIGTVVLLSVSAAFLAAYALAYLQVNELLNENTAARLQAAAGDSGRVGLALKAWEAFAERPWLGQGIGTTAMWEIRAHNMYLTLAAEHGVVGLLLYPAFALAVVLTNRAAAGFAIALLVLGTFSHNVLEDRYSLLIIALAIQPVPSSDTPVDT